MWFRLIICSVLTVSTLAVDHDVFKTCNRSDFCSRLRDKEPVNNFLFDFTNIVDDGYNVLFNFTNVQTNQVIVMNISAFGDGIFRVVAEEENGSRYPIPDVLNEELLTDWALPLVTERNDEDETYSIYAGNSTSRALVSLNPFQIYFYRDHILQSIFNSDPYFNLENDGNNQSITFGISFPGARRVYGIPEHADSLALRDTKNGDGDPYRLYNLDVAFYELESPMALYGSVPILYGQSVAYTSAVFVHNAAEQWIDIEYTDQGASAYFMVESGMFDLFFLTGPRPENAVMQFASLVGAAPLPQIWALGYHTCRWNYLSQEDVKEVIANFDRYDFPIDVIWGDVDTQDYHRQFTWEPDTFSDPVEMLNNLSSTDRKFVIHVDPHYKVDPDYFVYAEGLENGYFVKDENGDDFVGECWPGNSTYIDFTNPDALEWYYGLFSYERYNGSTPALAGIWNDMNEPSVFDDSLEKTFPKFNQFYGSVVHRDIHNIFGFLQAKATYQGLINRDNGTQRPFILSRSFFAGSQRYAAVWTGDNTADWDYLASSYPMCLSINLAGIPFCGADMGGFFNDPDTELLTRWYQAGAWLPFFRAHASSGTIRREPYLYDNVVQIRLRAAMRTRYAHLPYWYTLFFEHSLFGVPVIRPLFYQYPQDADLLDVDTQLLVGRNILATVVAEPNATSVEVYLPGRGDDIWYDIETPLLFTPNGFIRVNVTLDASPVFYRGGSIVPRRNIARRNTKDMFDDPYILYIFLDHDLKAFGTLYVDDTESFKYEQGEFSYLELLYEDGDVAVNPIFETSYDANVVIDAYVIYRPPSQMQKSLSAEPVKVEPIIYRKSPTGQDFKNMQLHVSKRHTVKLF